MKIFLISGLSGAGKTSCIKILEDLGYYCIENIPSKHILFFIKSYLVENKNQDLALLLDIKNKNSLNDILKSIPEIINLHKNTKLIFLDSSTKTLIKRYSEVRRPHPFKLKTLEQSIEYERELLSKIKESADIVIDTSFTSIHELKNKIYKIINNKATHESLNINIISFAFKDGIPADATFVFDVRFLPNPYFKEELKNLTGLDKPVIKYLNRCKEIKKFLKKLYAIINFALHQYSQQTNLTPINIAIGCTGGQHRSVYITEKLKKHLIKRYPLTTIRHLKLS